MIKYGVFHENGMISWGAIYDTHEEASKVAWKMFQGPLWERFFVRKLNSSIEEERKIIEEALAQPIFQIE